MNNNEVLGIDIGGVIIDRANDGTKTSFFGDNYLQTTAIREAFETIKKLVDRRFGEHVYLVSRCGEKIEARTLEWLAYHDFYGEAGVKIGNTRFCRERHQKAAFCESLGITHFIDDRLEVLSYLTSVDNLFLFQPRADEIKRFAVYLSSVKQANSWKEISMLLL